MSLRRMIGPGRPAAGAAGSELDRLDDEIDHLASAEHAHRNRPGDDGLDHQPLQVTDRLDHRAVEREEQVPGPEAGSRSGAPGHHVDHFDRGAAPERLAERG